MTKIKNITRNFSLGSLGLAGTTMGAISLIKEPTTSKEETLKIFKNNVEIECQKDAKQETCQCTIKLK